MRILFILKTKHFFLACESGKLEIVQYFLSLSSEHGIDPSANDSVAFRVACKNGMFDVVKLLLSLASRKGIRPNAFNNQAVMFASESGNLNLLKLLVSYTGPNAVDIFADDNICIYLSAQWDNRDTFKYLQNLYSNQEQIFVLRNYGILCRAVFRGDYKMLCYFLQILKNTEIDLSFGNNFLLRSACVEGNFGIMRLLMDFLTEKKLILSMTTMYI